MIKQIHLEQFGKFRQVTFNLSPITIFVGHNEAGKTTLFDALLDGICAPRGNNLHGKRLKSRYGDEKERRAKLIYEDTPFKIDADEFVNLYAVHSGNTNLDFVAGKSWLEKIKAALFTGGLDPASIRDALLQEATTDRRARQMQLLKARQDELLKLQTQLKQYQEKRSQILNDEVKVKAAGQELFTQDEQIKEKEKLIVARSTELEQQRKIKERQEYKKILELLAKGKELNDELQALLPFKEDRSTRLKEQQQKIQSLEEALRREEAQLEVSLKEQQRKEEKARSTEMQRQAEQRLAGFATETLSALRNQNLRPVIRKKTHWQPFLLGLAILFPGLGCALFFVVKPLLIQLVALLGACLFSALLLFLSRRTEELTDETHIHTALKQVKEDWNLRMQASRLSCALMAESAEGLTRELMQYQNQHDTTMRLQKELDTEAEELTKIIRQKQTESLKLKNDYEQAKALLAAWLQSKGVLTPTDYNEKHWKYKTVNAALFHWTDEQNSYLARFQCANLTALSAECTRLLTQLDQEIVQAEKPQLEVKKLEAELQKARTELDRLKLQQTRLSQSVSEGKGVVKGSLGEIPETIVQLERAIVTCQQAMAELELTRQAAALASDIFGEIARDADVLLAELSQELARHFGELLPGLRRVDVTELNQAAIQVVDAGGALRPLEHLSKGTIDAFYFAARLALAGMSTPGKALLVFDEPFHALDSERISRALQLLHKFYKKYGWQIIFFSKDKELAEEIRQVFAPHNGEVTINLLTPYTNS